MTPLQNAVTQYFISKGWTFDGNSTNTLYKSADKQKRAVVKEDDVDFYYGKDRIWGSSITYILKEQSGILKYFIET